jgi:hypothetical protein
MKEESNLEAITDFTEETVNVVVNTVLLFWCIIYTEVTAAQVWNTLKISQLYIVKIRLITDTFVGINYNTMQYSIKEEISSNIKAELGKTVY